MDAARSDGGQPSTVGAGQGPSGELLWTPLDEARMAVYRVLSLAASDPLSERWSRLLEPELREAAEAAAEFIAGHDACRPDELAGGESPPSGFDLAGLFEFASVERQAACEEHQRVFGLVQSKECPPSESDYCPQTFSVYRSQRMADVAGFYRAFGLQPSRDMPEAVDHVALELEFMAWLLAKRRHALKTQGAADDERAAVCAEAERAFFEEHLAWWLPAFAKALRIKADGGAVVASDSKSSEGVQAQPPASLYAALGACLAAFVPAERGVLGVPPPSELASPTPTEEPSGGCDDCGGDEHAERP